MFLGLVPLVAVVLVRLITVRGHRAPLLSLGLGAISVAFIVRLSVIDEAIDPRVTAAANVTDLWHVLLAGGAWWTLGALNLPVIVEHPRVRARLQHVLDTHRCVRAASRFAFAGRSFEDAVVRLWAAANILAASVAWWVWLLGDVSRVEVDDMMQLHDPGSLALIWVYLAWAFVGGLIVVCSAVISLPDPEVHRITAVVLLGIGICGIGISVTGAAMLVAGDGALAAHFPKIMLLWGVPGLLLLAMVGVMTAAHREDID